MSDASDKVIQIFRELAGERAGKLDGSHFPANINSRITQALAGGEDAPAMSVSCETTESDFTS